MAPSAYCLGGVQVWLNDLVAALQADPHWQVKVALPSGAWHRLDRYLEVFPRLPAVQLMNPTGSAEGRRRSITAVLLRERPDLVVGVNIADLYAAVRRARSRGFRGRVVLSLHALAADLIADVAAEVDLLDAVIATNKLSCRLLERLAGVPAGRVFYAPYGVVLPSPVVAGGAAVPRPSAPLRIAWVGRLEAAQKRVADLAGILRQLDAVGIPFHLTVAGDGPERDSLARALAPWLKAGVASMPGALSGPQLLQEVYATHQVLLITSSWETGPIVAWEAMAAGLAVVSSAYLGSGLEGALRHGCNALLFPVGDMAAAADALKRVSDLEVRAGLVNAGRRLVQERYSADAAHRVWCESFAQVLALPPRGPVLPEPPLPPSGRLERLVGPGLAEALRRRLSRGFRHTSPGGEWPHTAHGDADEQGLFDLAAELDHDA
ncbi:glycosyltransferase family 4 protein [Synechococcus sp. CS-1328]|uniref:glycosyltransferase family 4 protein n=1 Tax=Synechococcus sp. CS-1328 TaxID=2847976 RepID=UPI00223B4E69|nr:glycosyltransferase family 4 protein [Synechococcus sp. CS-1328]MCT0225909.1 glycosyltransferase family 4 protein [Synechococcus sp. CS-1328]